jgi:hypothetical protein
VGKGARDKLLKKKHVTIQLLVLFLHLPVVTLSAMQPNQSGDLNQLDQEIAALERQLSVLKVRRNSLVPFCRLPPEIIARVLYFTQVASPYDGRSIKTPWIDYSRRWIECTRVCRRLRDVALQTPSLWTFIESDGYEKPGAWEELCATRAKNCLLDISGPGHHILNSSLENIASAYTGRARRMSFYLTESSDMTFQTQAEEYEKVLSAPVPYIEYLECNMDFERLPPHLLGGTSSSLTHLTLQRVAFEDMNSAPYLPALLVLELDIYRVDGARVRQFVALLTNTPSLEMLKIEFDPCEDRGGPHETMDRVSLSHLRTLHVSTVSEELSWLLQIIPWPNRDLGLDCSDYRNGKPDPVVYDYLIRFWSEVAKDSCIFTGRVKWTDGTGALLFGEEFDGKTDTTCPRLLFHYPYCATTCQLPLELIELIESADFYGKWKSADINALQGFGRHVHRIVVQHVTDMRFLPPDFDAWIRKQAKAGYPLESVNFIRCRGLHKYAQELRKEAMVGQVLWDSDVL